MPPARSPLAGGTALFGAPVDAARHSGANTNLFGSRRSTSDEEALRAVMEQKHGFHGEAVGLFHFFTQFRDVIFRYRGSVFPHILIELVLAFTLGWVAYFMHHNSLWRAPWYHAGRQLSDYGGGDVGTGDGDFSASGHTMLGFLLGFLTVFRTQSGFTFFLEGLQSVNAPRAIAPRPRAPTLTREASLPVARRRR